MTINFFISYFIYILLLIVLYFSKLHEKIYNILFFNENNIKLFKTIYCDKKIFNNEIDIKIFICNIKIKTKLYHIFYTSQKIIFFYVGLIFLLTIKYIFRTDNILFINFYGFSGLIYFIYFSIFIDIYMKQEKYFNYEMILNIIVHILKSNFLFFLIFFTKFINLNQTNLDLNFDLINSVYKFYKKNIFYFNYIDSFNNHPIYFYNFLTKIYVITHYVIKYKLKNILIYIIFILFFYSIEIIKNKKIYQYKNRK